MSVVATLRTRALRRSLGLQSGLTLRSRIVLLFLFTITLFAGLIGGPAWIAVSSEGRAQEAVTLRDQDLLWQKSVEIAGQPELTVAKLLSEDPQIDDGVAVGSLLAAAAARLPRVSAEPARIDLVDHDGRLVASSAHSGQEQPMVSPFEVARQLLSYPQLVTIERGAGQQPLMTVAAAATPTGGFVAVAGDFAAAVTSLAGTLKADVFVVDLQGRLVVGTRPALWSSIAPAPTLLQARNVFHLARDGKSFELVPSTVVDSAGNAVATVFTLRDVTLETQRRLIFFCLIGALAAFLLTTGGVNLYAYLHSALLPLGEVAGAVRALSRGDTMVSVNPTERADEVGQIAVAVEVFRRNAVELDRLAFKARLDRAQEEALIRREMTRLAEMLDPEARAEIIADLDRLRVEAGRTAAGAGGEGSGALLSRAFRHMAARVEEAHRRLSDLLVERTRDLEIVREALEERSHLTRLREELKIAHELQLSSLPAQFPERYDFDLHAAMRPAKEVGGDFYDFVLLDDDRMALMIGDASGKGVSAAMFIATGRSLIRAAAMRGAPPSDCLEVTNKSLSLTNEAMMFVTAFVAVIDLRSGEIVYSNGGHNLPYIKRADGSVTVLDHPGGMALGVVEEAAYTDARERLAPGDLLVLYTDGVTEAFDEADAMFTDARLVASLECTAGAAPKTVIEGIIGDVDRFAGAAEQADDITVMCLRYLGPEAAMAAYQEEEGPMLEEILPNRLDAIADYVDRMIAFCREQGVAEDIADQLGLVVDELATNVVSYAWNDGMPHTLKIGLQRYPDRLELWIEDDGKPFDPLGSETPDLDFDLENRPVGGLGIHFVRHFSTSMQYERRDGRNRLTLSRNL